MARWGKRLSLLDLPNERSSHARAVPKGGGVGILGAFLAASLVLNVPPGFWAPAVFLSLVSFRGDRREIPVLLRLGAQLAAGAVLCASVLPEGLSAPMFAVLWAAGTVFAAGTANYYNFMDGIDGIAGIAGVVAFGLLGGIGGFSGLPPPAGDLALCLAFACVGFLPFNAPRARVFMGDAGSVLLGFVFAGLVLQGAGDLADFLVLCGFLFPFYADELTTAWVRLKDGESLLEPHRRHLYQLLANEMGVDHWKVSLGYGAVQALAGLGGLAARPCGLAAAAFFLAACFAAFAWCGFWVRSRCGAP